MSPEDITALVQQVGSLIGDPATSAPVINRTSAGMTVDYTGADGDYSIALSGDSFFVLFGDLAAGKVQGVYNLSPFEPEQAAATIISHVLSDIGPLSFVVGYESQDSYGVNWKRFTTAGGDLWFLTQRVADPKRGPVTNGEIIAGNLIVGFRQRGDGAVEDFRSLPESQLAQAAHENSEAADPQGQLGKVTDPQEVELEKLLASTQDAESAVLEALLAAHPPGAVGLGSSALEGAEACEYLERCLDWLAAEARQACTAASAARWFYVLRRLARYRLAGRRQGRWITNQFTAEVLSATAGETERASAFTAGRSGFDIGQTPVPELQWLLACSKRHAWLAALYRWCAKGASLRLSADGTAGQGFEVAGTPELSEAIALYDDRTDTQGGDLSWQTQSGVRLIRDPEGPHEALICAFPYSQSGPIVLDQEQFADVLPHFRKVLGAPPTVTRIEFEPRFMPETIGVAAIREFVSRVPMYEWDTTALAALLVCLRAAFIRGRIGLVDTMLRGYLLFTEGGLAESVEKGLRDLRPLLPDMMGSVQVPDVLHWLESTSGSAWPRQPGPMVRRSHEGVYLDIAAATARLRDELTIPGRGGGRLPNLRGGLFEQNVQEVMDSSPWSPGQTLKVLRGRSLRLRGKTITDLDAVAEHDGALLAISAKSVPYHADYDRGDYRLVRNLADRCDTFVEEWTARMAALRADSIGDNYDLSQYREVIGVVCLPFVPFCRIGPATQFAAPGLRAVCSLAELAEWTRTDPAIA